MSSKPYSTFGDNLDPVARKRRARERAEDSRLALAQRRREWAKPQPTARFTTEEHKRLVDLAAAGMFGRAHVGDAAFAWSALGRTVRCTSTGFVAIAPSPEHAARLAAWMRSPGVNAYCLGLQRLDELAGTPTADGSPVDMTPRELVEIITKIEEASSPSFDAVEVAAFLRKAGIYRSMARVFATRETAQPIADALHAVGASRFLVQRFDHIAGRAGFRPV